MPSVNTKGHYDATFGALFMDSLEARIKKARQYAKLTQPKLAELVGVSRRTLVNYEKNASNAAVATVQKIAIVCEVDDVWLLTGRGEMFKSETVQGLSGSRPPHADLVELFDQQDLAWDINWELLKLEKVDKKELYEVLKFIKFRRFSSDQSDHDVDDMDFNGLREKKDDEERSLKNGTDDM